MKIRKHDDQRLLLGKETEEIDEDLELKAHIIYSHKIRYGQRIPLLLISSNISLKSSVY